MQNPQKTGAFISRLRKAQNWTQLELADRLSVTHQAVSRWETGSSFPDLGTLVRVAQLFGVDVDAILNGELRPHTNETVHLSHATLGEVLTELAQDHPEHVAQMVYDDHVPLDTVIAAGPLTTPMVMDRLATALERFPFSHQQLNDLAPFLSQETLGRLVHQAEAEAPQPDLIVQLAPFLGPALLDRMVQQMIAGTVDVKYVQRIAPFLSREQRARLMADQQSTARDSEIISSLMPFLDAEQLDELVARSIEGTLDRDLVVSLAPFLGQPALLRLIETDPQHENGMLKHLAPFLAQDTIAQILHLPAAQHPATDQTR